MSHEFRTLLCKIGSGTHTGESLTRTEAKLALQLMLKQVATPAQIGAFLIAHRIRRPTGAEMAGMLDACDELGPYLKPLNNPKPVLVMGSPYDGRCRTLPLSPLVALVLAAAGQPVVLHGGERMPTKAGLPLVDMWRGLGVDWGRLSLDQVHLTLSQVGIGLVYLPTHFPQAQGLVPYREQIGKRPPLATLELIWSPYRGAAHVACGFVHPPTEAVIREAFALRAVEQFTTVKGLEGSCDLPRERTGILGLADSGISFRRLHLHPREYGLGGKEIPLTEQFSPEILTSLAGEPGELGDAVLWNGGFYLWRCGACADLASGLDRAREIWRSGQALTQLRRLQQIMNYL